MLAVSLLTLASSAMLAATPEQVEFFETRIRPVLAQECYECHSTALKKKGGLLLDSRAGLLAGGESGAVIVVGDAKSSLLMQSIRHDHTELQMPKNGAKLQDKVIADFERWINSGATDPRDAPPSKDQVAKESSWEAVLERRKQWWALQPLQTTAGGPAVVGNPVDAFVHAKLHEQALQQLPRADPATILRRLSYVLTGLAPTREALDRLRQVKPSELQPSLDRLADEMLQSSQFGETWARHWMDWVRYAESYGSEGDPPIPNAWRYRDYLIRAFNAGVPYPQLVKEAIAGDLLPRPRLNGELGINESALGIGQLRMVNHGFSPTDTLDEMVTFTDNQIDVVSKAFQGLTVSCARCHNHKFDAISQSDFYAWFGVFSSTHPAVVDVRLPEAGKAERAALLKLKPAIRAAMGKAWLVALGNEVAKVSPSLATDPKPAADAADTDILARYDLRTAPWFRDGKGIAQGASKAGEFSIAITGEKVIERIYPSGLFSDLISSKDRAVIMSPTFKCDGGTLWMRAAGGGTSRAKYVVQNYPRTGTIHKAKEFKDAGDETLEWRKLDLDYWKGDTLFIQCSTSADLPVESKDERSWFGLTEVVITRGSKVPPSPETGGDPRAAVQAWLANSMTDAQALLLSELLRKGKLSNDPKTIAEAAALLTQYREIEARLPSPIRAPGVLEADAHDAALFVRGDHKQPGEVVKRRFLESIDARPFDTANSGRLQLAEHLISPTNPLASRVIVNRLWHHVFGRGIVSTTDNFGKLGALPTHPELLDYLADRFIKSGGSIKDMLRLLVTSQTFQAADTATPEAQLRDPENKLLSHWTVRRLDAEAVRDSIVNLSGKLDTTLYGEAVLGKEPRRSVYVQVIRNRLDDFLAAFDAPVPMTTRGTRDVTNVPAQSLALLNSPNVQRWTSLWAADVVGHEPDEVRRTQRMFMQALGRAATAEEVTASLRFVKASSQVADEQRAALAEVEAKATELRGKISNLLDPVRAKLSKNSTAKPAANVPQPYAEWDFKLGSNDLLGHLALTLEGSARIENGALLLDGKGWARSALLPKDLHAKTLEAWVQLDTLDQHGGGVVTVQDPQGVVFDSIVYAESQAQQWLAGSDNHKRTQSFNGQPDADAASQAVHVAITYESGKVVAYREGAPYGSPFDSGSTATFRAGQSVVLLGCRHGSASGNKGLHGRILRARLYDRALSATEIAASHTLESTGITQQAVLAELTESQRADLEQIQRELEHQDKLASALSAKLEGGQPELAGWQSLALSMINLKEFIYLK